MEGWNRWIYEWKVGQVLMILWQLCAALSSHFNFKLDTQNGKEFSHVKIAIYETEDHPSSYSIGTSALSQG